MSQLRDIRKKIGLTQEQLAEIAGCTAQYIGQLERGERRLKADFITSLVKSLHKNGYKSVQPSDFLEGAKSNYEFEQSVPVYSASSTASLSLNENSVIDRAPLRSNMGEEGFYLIVACSLMEPRYEKGERIAVSRTLSPKKGKDCVIEFIDGSIALRRFLELTEKTLLCEQLNPRKNLEFNTAEIVGIYAVVGNEF